MDREHSEFDILNRIQQERQKRNWTEYALAKNSGMTQSTISSWYRENRQPSVASIEKICKGLGISLSEFFLDDSSSSMMLSEKENILDCWDCMSPVQRQCLLDLLHSFLDWNLWSSDKIILSFWWSVFPVSAGKTGFVAVLSPLSRAT